MNKIKMKIKRIIKDNLNKMFGNKELFNNLKMTWRLTKGARKYLIPKLICIIILAVVGAIVPIISAKGLIYINRSLWDKLINLTLLMFIIEFSRNSIRYISNKIGQKYFRESLISIQVELAKETMKLKTSELDNNSSGLFIQRLNSDTNKLASIFQEILYTIVDIATNLGVFGAIFIVSKEMFLYFLITIIVLFKLNQSRTKRFFQRDKELREISEKNTTLIGEMVRGIRDVKLLNSEENFINKVKESIKNSNEKRYEMFEIARRWNYLIENTEDIFEVIFTLLGILLITNNRLSIENMIIIGMYKGRLNGLLGYFTRMLEHIKEFNLSANRVFELFEGEKFKKEEYGEKELENVQGNIEFKNVEFGYTENKKVLKDISFKINAHEKVAFVGKSGQGKSTIFSLISKMYTPNGGEILIDNVNINELAKNTLRNNIAIVNQMPYIFNMTIKENLQIIKPDVTDEEIIEVCKSASLHETIVNMENGYDTVVGEGGVTLSGGQRQRLAIARALLTNSKIILFDEATSALDNETQTEITKAIDNLKGKYTILIVAHRLSTIVDCDRIFIVDNGKIKASGTHKELMKNSKTYKKLYESEV